MGTVTVRGAKMMRRLVLAVAALAIAAPSIGHAATREYTPAWQLGSTNAPGDVFNRYVVDAETGQMTLARAGATPATIGCGGSGPFANFIVEYPDANVVKSVTIHYENTLLEPYAFMHAGIYRDGHYVDSVELRGPILGSGDVVLDLSPSTNIDADVTGPFTVEFGLNIGSACPNVDGGTATFTKVTIIEA